MIGNHDLLQTVVLPDIVQVEVSSAECSNHGVHLDDVCTLFNHVYNHTLLDLLLPCGTATGLLVNVVLCS